VAELVRAKKTHISHSTIAHYNIKANKGKELKTKKWKAYL